MSDSESDSDSDESTIRSLEETNRIRRDQIDMRNQKMVCLNHEIETQYRTKNNADIVIRVNEGKLKELHSEVDALEAGIKERIEEINTLKEKTWKKQKTDDVKKVVVDGKSRAVIKAEISNFLDRFQKFFVFNEQALESIMQHVYINQGSFDWKHYYKTVVPNVIRLDYQGVDPKKDYGTRRIRQLQWTRDGKKNYIGILSFNDGPSLIIAVDMFGAEELA